MRVPRLRMYAEKMLIAKELPTERQPMSDFNWEAIYNRLEAEIRGGCCDQQRRPCVRCSDFLDGVDCALIAVEDGDR